MAKPRSPASSRDPSTPERLGRRLQIAREARGWTATELSRRIGMDESGERPLVSQQVISVLEQRNSATSEFAPQLADALSVSLRWLLSGKGRPADTDWPFNRVNRDRWDACTDEDRGYIQAAINKALDDCEASRTAARSLPQYLEASSPPPTPGAVPAARPADTRRASHS